LRRQSLPGVAEDQTWGRRSILMNAVDTAFQRLMQNE